MPICGPDTAFNANTRRNAGLERVSSGSGIVSHDASRNGRWLTETADGRVITRRPCRIPRMIGAPTGGIRDSRKDDHTPSDAFAAAEKRK